MSQYIYHIKPEPMNGNHLLPLNQMNKDSDTYKMAIRKYRGREVLMETKIPMLDCLWNDVIHFSSISPQLIYEKLLELGAALKFTGANKSYYKIPVEDVVSTQSVIYDFSNDEKEKKKSFNLSDSDTSLLSKIEYSELSNIPNQTVAFWKQAINSGKPVLWYPYIPHIFVKGAIDISKYEPIPFDINEELEKKNESKNWDSYYKKIFNAPPRPLLLKGLNFFKEKGLVNKFAIDFGAGAGNDSHELLKRGFRVFAIDAEENACKSLRNLPKYDGASIEVIHSKFEFVELPKNQFFYASLSLPFCSRDKFNEVWTRVVKSIEPKGIFCGNFFGPKDTWAGKLVDKSKDDIIALLSDFEILEITEIEKDAPSATGPEKHWHIIDVVAQKK